MATPNIVVEVAFEDQPLDVNATFTDITEYVGGFQVQRGRDYEFNEVEAGTATLNLDNSDGRFTAGRTGISRHLISPSYLCGRGEAPKVYPQDYYYAWVNGAPGGTINDVQTTVKPGMIAWIPGGAGAGRYEVKVPPKVGDVARVTAGTNYTIQCTARRNDTTPEGTGKTFAYRLVMDYLNADGTFLTGYIKNISITNVEQTFEFTTVAPTNSKFVGWRLETQVNFTASDIDYLEIRNVTIYKSPVNFAVETVSPYWPNIRPRRAVQIWVEDYGVFKGFVEKWPARFDSTLGTSDVTLVDGFGFLGSAKLAAPIGAFTRSKNPLLYYPMNEASGATNVTEVMANRRTGVIRVSPLGGAASMGGEVLPTYGDAGGGSFCVTTADYDKVGAVLELQTVSDPRVFDLGRFCMSFFYDGTRPSAGTTATLVYAENGEIYDPSGGSANQLESAALKIEVRDDGSIRAWMYSAAFNGGIGMDAVITSAANVIPNGGPCHIMLDRQDTVLYLYVNGTLIGSVTNMIPQASLAANRKQVRNLQIGGQNTALSKGAMGLGCFSNLAIWGDGGPSQSDAAGIAAKLAAMGLNKGSSIDRSETTRIGEILDYAGWPTSWRSVGPSAGNADALSVSTLAPADWESGASALEVLQKTATDAGGTVFIDRRGKLAYRNRQSRINPSIVWSIDYNLGVDLSYEPGLFFEMDEDRIANEVIAKRAEGVQAVSSDAASIAEYGRRTTTLEIGVATDNEAADAAAWHLYRYKDPMIRCDQLVINFAAYDSVGDYFYTSNAEIGNLIRVGSLPEAGPFTEATFFIEGVQHDVSISGETPEWKTTLQLSPSTNTNACVLDDAEDAYLDDTAILTY
jgi:hypothetical protein